MPAASGAVMVTLVSEGSPAELMAQPHLREAYLAMGLDTERGG